MLQESYAPEEAKTYEGKDKEMKYLTEEKFMVNSVDKESIRRYRDNWDAVFGDEEPDDYVDGYICAECCDTGAVVDPNVDPTTVETEGDLLKQCPSCTKP